MSPARTARRWPAAVTSPASGDGCRTVTQPLEAYLRRNPGEARRLLAQLDRVLGAM
jgi:hypothetical protein